MRFLRVISGTTLGIIALLLLVSVALKPVTAPLEKCQQETNINCYDVFLPVAETYYGDPTFAIAVGLDMFILLIPTLVIGYSAKKLLIN